MYIQMTAQTILTVGALVGAISGLVALFVKLVHWVDRQKAQDEDIRTIKAAREADNHAIQEELTLLTYGVLACLKGLKEQGCNGPVTEAVNKIEKHINTKAHKQ